MKRRHNSSRSKGEVVKTADLHMHTSLSDGELSVTELIDRAVSKKLHCISLTDHDNIDGYASGLTYAKEKGIEFIPGVELSAVQDGKDIHILGYFFDVTNLNLNLELQEQVRRRHSRAKAIVKKLNSMGLDITFEKVIANCKSHTIGRPHIAKVLVEEEYVSSFAEAFNKYLGDSGGAFVEKKGLSTEEAIKMVKNAGGIAVMAHPYATNADHIIEDMVEYGLQGIETYNYLQKGKIGRKYRELAKKYNLICSGGSDFHGPSAGCDLGALKMPYSVVERLKDRLESDKANWF